MTKRILDNRYRLDKEIGRGGMGTVYKGYDTLLGRIVAVKLLTSDKLGTEGRNRLLEEARAVAKLNHPNIVVVYDAGESKKTPYVVMEYIDGESLHETPPRGIKGILEAADQICSALDEAHTHGIIHRDLKPENIIRTNRGVLKLTDFGLAQSLTSRTTDDGALEGTVYYLSPEQALGRPLNGRTDLYSLGVMLYEFITDRLPFEGNDPLLVIAGHIDRTPTPPSDLIPDIPRKLDQIILRLLAKNPDDRFSSARELQLRIRNMNPTHEMMRKINPKHNIPEELTSFVGREKELKKVGDLLLRTRLITLTGVGGTGKSRLAYHAARSVIGDFKDGVWLIELAPISDGSMLLMAVANTLSIREQKEKKLLTTIIEYLQDRQMLILIDNCEHLIRECAGMIEKILSACPSIKILATSRESLGVSGETTFFVPSMSVPEQKAEDEVDDIWEIEAMRLFFDRAILVNSDFSPDADETKAVAKICRRLDGMPLAIELAAARARILPVKEIATRLSDRFRLLTGGNRSAVPRQQTLQALIDWSYDLLTLNEKVLLRRLSVFSSGWTITAAEEVCAEIDIPKTKILDLLARLMDKSMINPVKLSGEARYSMLETIRQYALEKLIQSDEIQYFRNRHLFYFTSLAETISPKLWGNQQVRWMDSLDTEHDNLRTALEWGISDDGKPPGLVAGTRIANSLIVFWMVRGYWVEAWNWVNKIQAAPAFKIMDEVHKAELLNTAGNIIKGMGDLHKSKELFNQALTIGRSIKETSVEAYALLGLAEIALINHFIKRAENYIERSLVIFESLDDKIGLALIFSKKGEIEADRGKYKKAKNLFKRNLDICRELGHALGIAGTLLALGNIEILHGDTKQGRKYLEECLFIYRTSKDKSGVAGTLSAIGLADLYAMNLSSSLTHYREALQINRELHSYPGMGVALIALGEISRTEGDYDAALTYYTEAIKLNEDLGQVGIVMVVAHNLGYVEKKLGDHKKALQFFRRSLGLAIERDHFRFIYFCVKGIACVYIDMGQQARGARLLGAAETLFQEQDYELDPVDKLEVEKSIDNIEHFFDDKKIQSLFAEGQDMSIEEVIILAKEK